MKTKFLLTALAFGLATATYAQVVIKSDGKATEKKKSMMIIKSDHNGVVTEETVDLSNLSDAERDAKIKSLMDSAKVKGGMRVMSSGSGKEKHVTVTVDDNNEISTTTTTDDDGKGEKRVIVRKMGRPGSQARSFSFNGSGDNFNFEMPEMPNMNGSRQMVFRSGNGGQVFINGFDGGSKASTVRSLQAFTNNPDKNILNVRFNAPKKGNVAVRVMDTAGKIVAQKDIKDFEGDFVGQLDLGKNTKGTYFLLVTQNEDGATRRVVID